MTTAADLILDHNQRKYAPEMYLCLRASVQDHAPSECITVMGEPCWPHRILAKIDGAAPRPPLSDEDGGRRGD